MQNVFVVSNADTNPIAIIPHSDNPEAIRKPLLEALTSHFDATEGTQVKDLEFKENTGDYGQSWTCKTFYEGSEDECDIEFIDLTLAGFYQ